MAFEFKFPDVGEGIQEGTIVKWHVAEGDEIKEDATLLEMETAKAVIEIPSPKTGTILKRVGREGDTVKVGSVLVIIGEKGEKIEQKIPKEEKGIPKEVEEKPKKAVGIVGALEEAKETGALQVLPAVRKLAKELGVDLAKIKGTGPGGRIMKEDVEKAAGTKKIAQKLPAEKGSSVEKPGKYEIGPVEHLPFKGIRKIIAEHMVKAKFTAPHVTHCDQCDVTLLVKIREKEKKVAEKEGIKLTYLPFIIKATIQALREYPVLNATLDEGAGEIILKKYYNIGIATDTPDGLMVPVIKNADKKTILELAKEIQELATRARSRKISIADFQGGTFTITNVGALGGTFFTPVINLPEVAILGVAAIREMPVIYKGKIQARHILNLCVTFDHRIVDGATAARFLNTIMKHLSDPDLLLVEA